MPAYRDEKTGKWYVQFYSKDWTGKRKKVLKRGFITKREAVAYEHDYLSREQGQPGMTFQALYEMYFNDCKARLRVGTVYVKKNIFEKWLIPYFGKLPINEIQPGTVRKWQNEIMKSGLSETYIKTINNQLTASLNFAVKYCNLNKNPVHISGSIGKKHRDKITFWTLEEFKKFISVLQEHDPARIAVETLFYTGMRRGELLALTLNDIDNGALASMTEDEFQKYPHEININKTYQLVQGKEYIGPPKTGKSKRVIGIPLFLAKILRAYVQSMYGLSSMDRVFPYTVTWLHTVIDRNAPRAGVKKIRVHDLRHSHASLLIELGFSPLLIKERLGHENIETTLQTYSHLYPSKETTLLDTLENISEK